MAGESDATNARPSRNDPNYSAADQLSVERMYVVCIQAKDQALRPKKADSVALTPKLSTVSTPVKREPSGHWVCAGCANSKTSGTYWGS